MRRRPDQMLEADPAAPELLGRFDDRIARGPQCTEHEPAPAQQRDEEQDLPEAAKLDVGEALVAEPEPAFVDHALDAEIIADQRGGDDEQRDPEQQVDEKALPFRLAATGDRRSDEQPARDPAQTDPDDRRLQVEAPEEIVRQDVVELDAVERLAIVIGVGHDCSGALRGEEHQRDHQEIFAGLDLTGCQCPILGKAALHWRIIWVVEIGPIEPQHEAHREKGEAEADPRPLEGIGGRGVADRGLIGPVLRPRGVRMVGPPRHGRDRRVDNEIGGLRSEASGLRLFAGTQPADRLTVLSLVVSSACNCRTACATESGSTTRGWVRSIDCSCFCIVAVVAASDRASAGELAEGVVGAGAVPAGPVVASDLLAGALVFGGVAIEPARLCLVRTPSRTSVEAV